MKCLDEPEPNPVQLTVRNELAERTLSAADVAGSLQLSWPSSTSLSRCSELLGYIDARGHPTALLVHHDAELTSHSHRNGLAEAVRTTYIISDFAGLLVTGASSGLQVQLVFFTIIVCPPLDPRSTGANRLRGSCSCSYLAPPSPSSPNPLAHPGG